jgi:hypothetical protein
MPPRVARSQSRARMSANGAHTVPSSRTKTKGHASNTNNNQNKNTKRAREVEASDDATSAEGEEVEDGKDNKLNGNGKGGYDPHARNGRLAGLDANQLRVLCSQHGAPFLTRLAEMVPFLNDVDQRGRELL